VSIAEDPSARKLPGGKSGDTPPCVPSLAPVELRDALRRRRIVRSYDGRRPVPHEVVEHLHAAAVPLRLRMRGTAGFGGRICNELTHRLTLTNSTISDNGTGGAALAATVVRVRPRL
jgi:hypothetical protein